MSRVFQVPGGSVFWLGSEAATRQIPGSAFVHVAAVAVAIPAGLVLGSTGVLAYKPTPTVADRRLFITADGHHVAATSQPSGSRPLTLSGGAWHAGSAS